MPDKEIIDTLISIIAKIKGVDEDSLSFVTGKSDIRKDVGLNSIGMLYAMLEIEKEYGVSMKNPDVERFKCVSDVVEFIKTGC